MQRSPTGLAARLAGALLALASTLPADARSDAPFNGRFLAQVQGQALELTLQQTGTSVEGVLQSPQSPPTQLAGQAQGQVASGLAGNAGGVGAFEARRDGDTLALVLAELGPDGSPQQARIEFRRAGAAPAAPSRPAAGAGAGAGGDPRLVGRWSKSESYRSGEFTAASETLMEIAADGRVAFGAGRVIAGDASTSADSGRGDVQVAEWRARGGVLSLREPGGPWQDIGRYQVSDAGMLIHLQNGSKELWYRQ